MTFVFCDDDTCKNNNNGTCGLSALSIETESGEFENGKRKIYPACQNYRGNEDGTD